MTGRAERVGLESLGLLQAYQPDHPVIKAFLSCQPEDFYICAIAVRSALSFPSLLVSCLFDCVF